MPDIPILKAREKLTLHRKLKIGIATFLAVWVLDLASFIHAVLDNRTQKGIVLSLTLIPAVEAFPVLTPTADRLGLMQVGGAETGDLPSPVSPSSFA